MSLIKQFFSWWSGQTWGTRFYTWRKGEYVGADSVGNRYYRAPSAIPRSIAERRWVIYNGYSEASSIPPGWHGWIHHKVDRPPSAHDTPDWDWQKPHLPNLTGTAAAYRPPGSIVGRGEPVPPPREYQPWRPQ
jgi:NADH:ubiquinone oxidoreductase subunit